MKTQIIDLKTGKDYTDYIPSSTSHHSDENSNSNDIIISEIVLPIANHEGFETPVTNMHILGVGVSGRVSKAEYHTGNKKWGKITPLYCENRLGIGAAGDNAMAWRWSESDVESMVSNIVIHLSPDKLAQIAQEVFDIDGSRLEVKHKMMIKDMFITQLAIAMRNQMSLNTAQSGLYLQESLHMLAVHIITHHCVITPLLKEYHGGLSKQSLNLVIEYLEVHYNQNISIDQLAMFCNISGYHFIRLFKQSTGVSPRQYLLDIRIRHAKHLLNTTQLLVEQIAYIVGYKNANNFTRMFKKRVGHSPNVYRNLG